jgi:hypothetical protein
MKKILNFSKQKQSKRIFEQFNHYSFFSQFFQQGNFQSAIGVYNHAVRIFPKMAM